MQNIVINAETTIITCCPKYYKKGLHQCAKLQDLGEGDYYCCDCDCYGGNKK